MVSIYSSSSCDVQDFGKQNCLPLQTLTEAPNGFQVFDGLALQHKFSFGELISVNTKLSAEHSLPARWRETPPIANVLIGVGLFPFFFLSLAIVILRVLTL